MPIMQRIKSKCSHCDYQYTYWQGDVVTGLDLVTKDVSCPKCKNGKVKIPLSEIANFNISPKTLYNRLKNFFKKIKWIKAMIQYIANEEHYSKVLEKAKKVKKSLWIGTSDIKDVYVKAGIDSTQPFLSVLSTLIKNGVEVRMLFAKEPGQNFRNDFDKYPLLIQYLETAICPRVHFKFFVFDEKEVYLGSANLTGAGMGMKSKNNRNFEAGILTTNPEIVEKVMNQFDEVWNGSRCQKCGRKKYCPLPIDKII